MDSGNLHIFFSDGGVEEDDEERDDSFRDSQSRQEPKAGKYSPCRIYHIMCYVDPVFVIIVLANKPSRQYPQ